MAERALALRGKSPAKWKRGCAKPLTLTAATTALGPALMKACGSFPLPG
jgi:hypothetical protein